MKALQHMFVQEPTKEGNGTNDQTTTCVHMSHETPNKYLPLYWFKKEPHNGFILIPIKLGSLITYKP